MQVEFTEHGFRQLQRAMRALIVTPEPEPPAEPAPADDNLRAVKPLARAVTEATSEYAFVDEAGRVRWVPEEKTPPSGWRPLFLLA